MKKILKFLRSMKFGLILLVLVMLCSLIGSLLPQASEGVDYTERFGQSLGQLLISLGFDDIFHSWYFYTLLGLLCINLLFCSLLRFSRTTKAGAQLKNLSMQAGFTHTLNDESRQKIEEMLKFQHFRAEVSEDRTVYSKNGIGFYGSFLTHLSILLILAFGGLVLLTPKVTDYTVMPGESLTLDGGITLRCDGFHINDADGRLDYASQIHIQDEDGNSKDQEIRVNEPLRFAQYKIYQQSYGTAGLLVIRNNENNAEEKQYLTEAVRLRVDEQTSLQFNALYSGYIEKDDGSYTLITSSSESYEDPVYDILVISDGQYTPVLAFPGDELTLGNITFRFENPVEYPGLRIKTLSPALFAGLYAGFALMVAALYLCFFAVPVCVAMGKDGCCIRSPKDCTALLAELESLGALPLAADEETEELEE